MSSRIHKNEILVFLCSFLLSITLLVSFSFAGNSIEFSATSKVQIHDQNLYLPNLAYYSRETKLYDRVLASCAEHSISHSDGKPIIEKDLGECISYKIVSGVYELEYSVLIKEKNNALPLLDIYTSELVKYLIQRTGRENVASFDRDSFYTLYENGPATINHLKYNLLFSTIGSICFACAAAGVAVFFGKRGRHELL